jgi:hypothetical protein
MPIDNEPPSSTWGCFSDAFTLSMMLAVPRPDSLYCLIRSKIQLADGSKRIAFFSPMCLKELSSALMALVILLKLSNGIHV